MDGNPSDWRESGVRIVRHGEFDPNTPQTPGMHREAAISRASAPSLARTGHPQVRDLQITPQPTRYIGAWLPRRHQPNSAAGRLITALRTRALAQPEIQAGPDLAAPTIEDR